MHRGLNHLSMLRVLCDCVIQPRMREVRMRVAMPAQLLTAYGSRQMNKCRDVHVRLACSGWQVVCVLCSEGGGGVTIILRSASPDLNKYSKSPERVTCKFLQTIAEEKASCEGPEMSANVGCGRGVA